MSRRQKRSFSEVAFVEAVARHATAYLLIRPIRRGAETYLRSRFLSVNEAGDLVLAAPTTDDRRRKVFLPIGWDVSIRFPVGDFLLQARTSVLGHCQFLSQANRRVDALVVERAGRVVAMNERDQPRREVDVSRHVAVSIWPADELAGAGPLRPRSGFLANRSPRGMGVRIHREIGLGVGARVVIRIEDRAVEACTICRAVLKHCTVGGDGEFLVGFGEVTELGPGQDVPVMESLASHDD